MEHLDPPSSSIFKSSSSSTSSSSYPYPTSIRLLVSIFLWHRFPLISLVSFLLQISSSSSLLSSIVSSSSSPSPIFFTSESSNLIVDELFASPPSLSSSSSSLFSPIKSSVFRFETLSTASSLRSFLPIDSSSLSLTNSEFSQLNNESANEKIFDPLLQLSFYSSSTEPLSSIERNDSMIGEEINDVSVDDDDDDSNDDEDQMERNIYILPLYQQIIWSIIFGTMVFVAAGGNLIVIWIVLTNKRMRTVTNYFLVNLSIADIMVSTLNVIFNFIYMLDSDWPFGELYCKVTNFIAILSVAASVFTLVAISIDRYLAIVHPLRPRMSRKTTVNIIVMIWIAGSLLSLPNIICSKTIEEEFKNGDKRVVCYLEWYDGISTKSRIEYLYNVIILLVTYIVPIASMSCTYFRVGRELWGSQSIGECTARQMDSIKSKRKIVKMMMIVVAIFGICWAPYHIYFLLAHHYPQIINSKYVQHTYLTIYWLAMSNSVYNPIVYCWMNSRLELLTNQPNRKKNETKFSSKIS
ncbi:neuropeptide GPCR A24 [Sarcoptes scabiei]|nr:neuropeptide GPCR A24 [Sarcoptes scabiei]